MMVAAGQVSVEAMHEQRRCEQVYTSELCRRLILWAWTRDRDQVKFTEKAQEAIKAESEKLCGKYSEALPLVDRGTIGHKLARLSAACAARVFSSDKAMKSIVVRAPHVEIVSKFLGTSYDETHVGYDQFSAAQRSIDSLRDVGKIKKLIKNTGHPLALVEGLLYRDDVTQMDIQDWSDSDRDFSAMVLSFLVRHHALRRVKRNVYSKTPRFIDLLRELVTEVPETNTRREEM